MFKTRYNNRKIKQKIKMKNKKDNISALSDQELIEKIKEEKAGLNKMTLNHAISPVENPSTIRVNRRNVARMLTVLNQRNKASK